MRLTSFTLIAPGLSLFSLPYARPTGNIMAVLTSRIMVRLNSADGLMLHV